MTEDRARLARTGLAAGASVLTSGAWYAAWGDRLARLDPAYAPGTPTPPWILPVELARSSAVALVVAQLVEGRAGPAARARLALALWAAFPGVLLTGSVVHEKVPWQQAAIHAGDWLVKLQLIALAVGARGAGRRGA